MSKEKPEVEIIAEFLHNIWANWYAHQRDNSTEENILRWEMQSKTLYKDLTEEDKEKDRKLARVLYKELFDVVPELTAKDVTKLMDITGCGMLACKHALIKFKGNSELALDYLMGGWSD